jgi:hypothetical protein
MAVTLIREGYGRQYTSDVTGKSSATRVYCVWTNSDYEQLTDLVRDAVTAGLPDLGDTFGPDSGETDLVVSSHIPKEVEKELRFFHIEVRYASNQIDFSIPTARIWDIQFSNVYEEYVPYRTLSDTGPIYDDSAYTGKVISRDVDQPIWNTAGASFDPPPTDNRSTVKITLTKNFTSIGSIGSITDITELMSYTNTVNLNAVTIAGITGPPMSFLIEDIQCANTIADGWNYFATTFTIIYDTELHTKKVVSAGWDELVPGNPALTRPITLAGGAEISSPVPLGANGQKVAGATVIARANNAIYIGFGLKVAKDFSTISLPTSFNHS